VCCVIVCFRHIHVEVSEFKALMPRACLVLVDHFVVLRAKISILAHLNNRKECGQTPFCYNRVALSSFYLFYDLAVSYLHAFGQNRSSLNSNTFYDMVCKTYLLVNLSRGLSDPFSGIFKLRSYEGAVS
jgi:hypothetical protein